MRAPTRVPWHGLLLLCAAAALFAAVRHDARIRLADAPIPSTGGAPIASVPRASATPAAVRPIEGAGTVASPLVVPFSCLSLPAYDPPALRADAQPLRASDLPAAIAQCDGKVVMLTGYVIAVNPDDAVADGVLLSRYPPGCCFGSVPIVDEWVAIEIAADARAAFPRSGMARVVGTFAAGEVWNAAGAESLYRLSAARGESIP